MITSFRHKGLEKFFLTGGKASIQPRHAERLRELLTALHAALSLEDLERPSWRLHPLKGDKIDHWAMTVQANWRLVFRFDGQYVELLDYLDYH
jgi:toxin HigB-1